MVFPPSPTSTSLKFLQCTASSLKSTQYVASSLDTFLPGASSLKSPHYGASTLETILPKAVFVQVTPKMLITCMVRQPSRDWCHASKHMELCER